MSLNDYDIFRVVGRGINGNVYQAVDIPNHREVALKETYINNEVNNHLLVNHLDCVPRLYNHFIDVTRTGQQYQYLSIQLINGDNLNDYWYKTKNWSVIWMTLYHQILVIDEFHKHGYGHGDIHNGNLIWTGDKMYIIDFDRIVDVDAIRDRLRTLDIDDNEYQQLRNKLIVLCIDYSTIFNMGDIDKIRPYNTFRNDSRGMERCQLLSKIVQSFPCEEIDSRTDEYVIYDDYISTVLREYERMDRLDNDGVLEELRLLS